jgi:hypothetical protein
LPGARTADDVTRLPVLVVDVVPFGSITSLVLSSGSGVARPGRRGDDTPDFQYQITVLPSTSEQATGGEDLSAAFDENEI